MYFDHKHAPIALSCPSSLSPISFFFPSSPLHFHLSLSLSLFKVKIFFRKAILEMQIVFGSFIILMKKSRPLDSWNFAFLSFNSKEHLK
jgi:hypothetical protein